MMRARYFAADNLWEVREGERWWTVSIRPSGAAHICNEKLSVIKPHGALGKRILAAIAKAQGAARR